MGEEDSPLALFLKALSQPRIQDSFAQESLSPVGYLAPFLQAWAVEHASTIAQLDGATEKEDPTPDYLHMCWRKNRECIKALESVVQSLSKCAACHNLSSIEALHQDYIALLQRSRDQSQYIMAFIQQISAMESIRESQRGVQSADSVRRYELLSINHTKRVTDKCLQIDRSCFCIYPSHIRYVLFRDERPTAWYRWHRYRLFRIDSNGRWMPECVSGLWPRTLGASSGSKEGVPCRNCGNKRQRS